MKTIASNSVHQLNFDSIASIFDECLFFKEPANSSQVIASCDRKLSTSYHSRMHSEQYLKVILVHTEIDISSDELDMQFLRKTA